MKYTITRAITLVKTLEDRYNKEVNELLLITTKRGEKLYYSHIKPEDFIKAEKEKYQSALGLFEQARKIKNAINQSNATTKITIGGIEMTVQEAIVYKNEFLRLKKYLLLQMKKRKVSVENEFKNLCEDNEKLIDKKAAEIIGSAGGDKTTAMQKAKEDVEKIYGVEMVDPVSLTDEITKLEKEISDFETNVDFALSEINATTFIEVD